MPIRAKVTAAMLAVTLVTAVTATSSEAEARGWGWGPALGVGIAAGALIGAAAAAGAYAPGYYYDPTFPRCHRVPQYDGYGNYVGSIRVCNAVPY
jgi:hypothetical protein